MKLPADAYIAREKLTRYFLVSQTRSDKSAFLAKAGYVLDNADQLLKDLRQQVLPLEARTLESNNFGQFHEIRSGLTGPNGVKVNVRTIWMTEHFVRYHKVYYTHSRHKVSHYELRALY